MPKPSRRRPALTLLAATGVVASLLAAAPAAAGDRDHDIDRDRGRDARLQKVQMLSFNDFHGHLEAGEDDRLSVELDPTQTPVGGAEYLASTLERLRAEAGDRDSITVAAGDLIGGSTFLSGLFHDEPAVESLDALGLDTSSVGNHEFDEGTEELLRMQYGGCHPVDGCYLQDRRGRDIQYPGADFDWLAANVVNKDDGEPLLPGTTIERVRGTKIGFIGMTLEATPTLVNPTGVATVDFLDEVETANAQAAQLRRKGVKAIVVLLHEGGVQAGTYDQCVGISGPIVEIAQNLHPSIDAVVTGHTHQPYTCSIPDPAGNPRSVTSAASFGRVVTETELVIDRRTRDVVRKKVTSTNHLVTRDVADPEQTAIIEKWSAIASPVAGQVVGTIAEDVTGDANTTTRAVETPMANLVADAILAGTSGENGGAQIAFTNVGGVRASFLRDTITNGEAVGEITYAEAYLVAPFGNLLVSFDLTGAQIKAVLEQQFVPTRGRQTLALGVSEGFTYTWDASQPEGSRVVADSMALDGVALDLDAVYRVGTLNFLAAGGDEFTVFPEGTDVVGGVEDIEALVAYLEANPGITPPPDRVAGL